MSAQYRDAAKGWELFRSTHGNVTLEEINQFLTARGYHPIALRTFNHYRKLQRLGYSSYVSINRLDIRHASLSTFDVEDRARYLERSISTKASLVLVLRSGVAEFRGTVGQVSEGFATFTCPTQQISERPSRPARNRRGILVFDRVGVERAVEVEEAYEGDGVFYVLLTFRSLLETDILFPSGPRVSGTLTVPLGEDPSFYQVLNVVHRTFDLYESLRGFADLYLTNARPGRDTVLASPRVQRINMASPMRIELVGDPLVWMILGLVVERVIPKVLEATERIQDMSHKRAEERRRREEHGLRIRALELSNLKEEIQVLDLVGTLDPAVRDRLLESRPAFLSDELLARLELFKNQAVESIVEITLEADGGFDVHAE